MKKNIRIVCIIILTLLVVGTCIMFFNTKDSLLLSRDFTDQYQMTIVSNSNDDEVIAHDSNVIKKRIKNFGARDVECNIEGNKMQFTYIGEVDNAQLRTYISQKGLLEVLDSADNQAIKLSDLSQQPLSLVLQDDEAYIKVNVLNSSAIEKTCTYLILAKSDLVFWVDKQDGQTFENEYSSNQPAYLACAGVNSKLSNDFYVKSSHDIKKTESLINIVNAGSLNSVVSEQDFAVLNNDFKINITSLLFIGLLATTLCFSIYDFIRFKTLAFVNGAMLFVYSVCLVIFSNFLDSYISYQNIVAFTLAQLEAILVIILINNNYENHCNNSNQSKDNYIVACKSLIKPIVMGQLIKLVSSLIILAVLKQFRSGAIVGATSSILFLLLIAVANNLLARNFASKNKTSTRKEINIISLLENRMFYIIIALVFVLTLDYLYSFNKNLTQLKYLTIAIALCVATTVLITILNKKTRNMIELLSVNVGAIIVAMSSQIFVRNYLVKYTDLLLTTLLICLSYGTSLLMFNKNLNFKNKDRFIEEDKKLLNNNGNIIFNRDLLIVCLLVAVIMFAVLMILHNLAVALVAILAIFMIAFMISCLSFKVVASNFEK